MKITTEIQSLGGFKAWSGAKDTQKAIIEAGKGSEFMILMEELYPEGMTETKLNDILWFEPEWIYETLGINQEQD